MKRSLKEREMEQMLIEEQNDAYFTSLTTMAKNSEVLRCSSELNRAFKMIPKHYLSLVQQDPELLQSQMTSLQE